jgi:hypothetical protein
VDDEYRAPCRFSGGVDTDEFALRPGEPDVLPTAATCRRGRRGSRAVVIVVIAARGEERAGGRTAHAQQSEPAQRLPSRQDAVGTVESDLVDEVAT